ncbi:endonuclease/exonuclease/phosphatase (EEP) superfamily protein YafD [Arcanobacterium wilhelmae]|uniref:Endonuclease/exonuclease/phosphatase (EEP) superfamily protein YafD n=1 Tax=Arcanobacterium wilhelmae TaxID=1803177 RepID=A0ABT9NBF7_9ACTO|nr:endonuclease/exonuclease/phosphatase family protein [Arcanobacterium wilhelmae]MDP9801042.1 endonuclease/exonuclease/phosphatase (EEP) superfamily protein YafD [Arcanobacterium wilhelmae]
MKYVWGLISLLLGAVAVLSVRPDLFGLSSYELQFPLAQLIAMRGVLAVIFLVCALMLGVFAGVRYKLVNAGRIAGALAAVLLVVAATHAGTVWWRGVSNPDRLTVDQGVSPQGEGNGQITVLTYNTLGGATDSPQLADVITKEGVDVVVLPETSTARGQELVKHLAAEGVQFQQFDTATSQYNAEFESTVVLVSRALGPYEATDVANSHRSGVSVAPVNGQGPHIFGVHPVAPDYSLMSAWRKEITQTYALCSATGPFIMAGDFNSTVDHQRALGVECADAGAQAGSAGLGSWPASLPSFFAAPIDRVITDGSYTGTEARLVKVGGSDHRGLLVRLAPKK